MRTSMPTTEFPVLMLGPGGEFTAFYFAAQDGRGLIARFEAGLSRALTALAAQAGRFFLAERLLGAHQEVVSQSCQSLADLSRTGGGQNHIQNFTVVRAGWVGATTLSQEAFHEPY